MFRSASKSLAWQDTWMQLATTGPDHLEARRLRVAATMLAFGFTELRFSRSGSLIQVVTAEDEFIDRGDDRLPALGTHPAAPELAGERLTWRTLQTVAVALRDYAQVRPTRNNRDADLDIALLSGHLSAEEILGTLATAV